MPSLYILQCRCEANAEAEEQPGGDLPGRQERQRQVQLQGHGAFPVHLARGAGHWTSTVRGR
eukprot:542921-Lingulodinium_polyedra.AAC.1